MRKRWCLVFAFGCGLAGCTSPGSGARLEVLPSPIAAQQSPVGTRSGSALSVTPVVASTTNEIGPIELSLARVTRIISGDTFEARIGSAVERIRLLGVNAPEITGQAECYGREATAIAADLLSGSNTLRLERDVTDRDRFGRLVRYGWLSDGRLLNEVLVAEGYAQLFDFSPDMKYRQRIVAAEQSARAAKRGMWSHCQTDPADTQSTVQFASVHGGPPGGRATVTVNTSQGVLCAIRYVNPAGTESQGPGLGNKQSDNLGNVVWVWTIPSTTPPGVGMVRVTCGSASARTDLIID
jgi:micrococcal nuclease